MQIYKTTYSCTDWAPYLYLLDSQVEVPCDGLHDGCNSKATQKVFHIFCNIAGINIIRKLAKSDFEEKIMLQGNKGKTPISQEAWVLWPKK